MSSAGESYFLQFPSMFPGWAVRGIFSFCNSPVRFPGRRCGEILLPAISQYVSRMSGAGESYFLQFPSTFPGWAVRGNLTSCNFPVCFPAERCGGILLPAISQYVSRLGGAGNLLFLRFPRTVSGQAVRGNLTSCNFPVRFPDERCGGILLPAISLHGSRVSCARQRLISS